MEQGWNRVYFAIAKELNLPPPPPPPRNALGTRKHSYGAPQHYNRQAVIRAYAAETLARYQVPLSSVTFFLSSTANYKIVSFRVL